MKKVILSVKNLNVSFGNEKVIKDLSFNVCERENLTIMGPNGAGKTTLFKALLGLIPYDGYVKWDKGANIAYLPSQEMISRNKLLPITVKDFFDIKGIKKGKAIDLLNYVNLYEKSILGKDLFELSTGQFQRMMIAWTLSDNPNVLLFDEPSSGIDFAGKKTIYDLLHKFWEENKMTILMITHDLNIVWGHSNYVLCLGSGHTCYGAPSKILSYKNLEEVYGTEIKFYKHNHKLF